VRGVPPVARVGLKITNGHWNRVTVRDCLFFNIPSARSVVEIAGGLATIEGCGFHALQAGSYWDGHVRFTQTMLATVRNSNWVDFGTVNGHFGTIITSGVAIRLDPPSKLAVPTTRDRDRRGSLLVEGCSFDEGTGSHIFVLSSSWPDDNFRARDVTVRNCHFSVNVGSSGDFAAVTAYKSDHVQVEDSWFGFAALSHQAIALKDVGFAHLRHLTFETNFPSASILSIDMDHAPIGSGYVKVEESEFTGYRKGSASPARVEIIQRGIAQLLP